MNDPQSTPQPFSIVVGFDDTEAGGYAFEQAARIARRIPASVIHLVYSYSDGPSDARSRQIGSQLRLYVDEKAVSLGGLAGQRVAVHVRNDDPVRAIVQLAADVTADLVVLGGSGHSHLKSIFSGSTADRVLAHSPCPVIIAGPKPAHVGGPELAIEPPCPDCLAARAASNGSQWWCARHQGHARSPHVYSYQGELPFATHDSEVIPTGIDF